MTAGSVGATAAPIRPAVIQPIPSAQWAKPVTSPAIAKVPGRPSSTTGTAASRKRRRPIDAPPSKRITTSAPLATSSTVWMESVSRGTRSDANAAATSSTAARGIGRRCTKAG